MKKTRVKRAPARRLPDANSEMIYFLHEWMTVAEVEARCRESYRAFDRLPNIVRQAINAGDACVDSRTAAKRPAVRRPSCRRHDHGRASRFALIEKAVIVPCGHPFG